MLKRQKLEEEGRDLSQLNEEIEVTASQKEKEWTQFENTIKEEYKLGDDTADVDDPKALRQKLDKKLVLLVQQQFGSTRSPWILPQMTNSGETLRQVPLFELILCLLIISDCRTLLGRNILRQCEDFDRRECADGGLQESLPEKVGYGTRGRRRSCLSCLHIYALLSCFQIFIYSAFINELDRPLKFNETFIKDYIWCPSEKLDSLIPDRHKKYKTKIRSLLFE